MSYYNQQQQGGHPPYQGHSPAPPPQGAYGQPPNQYQQQYPPQQGWNQPPPMQNQQYPQQGYPPQQQQWGQHPPPQGQYNAPPGQYPPPGQPQYGAPPPGQYQQPPPQQGWGQPPPPGQYGAPPPNQYGPPQGQPQYVAPPPGQFGAPPPQHGYNQPLPGQYQPPPAGGQYGPPTQPSLGYGSMQTAPIDMGMDVENIRKSMKGFGTDEKLLIGIVAKKDPIQMNTIRQQYDQRLMRNLVQDLEQETSGYFEKGLVAIARGPLQHDCYTLYEAMKGMGTKEAALDDVLIGRSNADINAIKAEYQRLFRQSLESDLRGDLSAGTEQMYMMIVGARRAEDSQPVIPQEIEQAVTDLQTALGSMVSKNSSQACQILTSKNDAQLRAMAQSYQNRFHKPLDGVIKSKFSGHMEDALRLLIGRAVNRAEAEAIRLEESMAGIGTKDELLVQRVVRCHWDRNFMAAVSAEYKKKYRKDLVRRIEGEVSGDYKKLMVACVQ